MSLLTFPVKMAIAAASWFAVPVLFKSIFKHSTCTSKKNLDGKVVMVTGANTGLGKVTAADLSSRGALVYMACRNMEKAADAQKDILKDNPQAKLKLIKLDLESLKSVKECAETFLKEEERLDILVENAGFGSFGHRITGDDIEAHLACNHLGHFYLTRLLFPVLENAGTESCKSRVVVVSSRAHLWSPSEIDYDKTYTGKLSGPLLYPQSKLANLLFVRHLSKLLAGKNVTANGLHPGTVVSDFYRHYFPFPFLYPIIYLLLFPVFYLLPTELEGSQTQIWASVDESLEGTSGQYLLGCSVTSPSAAARNDEEAEKLWRWSCSKTRLALNL